MNIAISLFIFWFFLSAQLSFYFIAMAIASITLIIALDNKILSYVAPKINVKILALVIILLKKIFLSAIEMLKIIWLNKSQQIQPTYRWIETKSQNHLINTLYANSITLTPGTMSVQIEGNKILVHAINDESMKDLEELENIILSKI